MRRAATSAALTVAFCAALAVALEPTGSTFPTQKDDFQAVQTKDEWTATDHNRLLDAVNELENAAFTAGFAETACAAFSVQPAQRKLVNVSLTQTTTGTEPVLGAVTNNETPARVVFDGVEQLAGTIAQVHVFNRDATNIRTGSVCVQVVRMP